MSAVDLSAPIRIRPFIRYLGALLGTVAALPSVLGCLYFLFHPLEALKEPGGLLFCVPLATILGGSTYRWWTICAWADDRQIYLRGLFRTFAVPAEQVTDIRRVYTRGVDSSGFSRVTWRYELFDADGNSLGAVPFGVEICAGWPQFLTRLQQRVAVNERPPNRDVADGAGETSADWSFDHDDPNHDDQQFAEYDDADQHDHDH